LLTAAFVQLFLVACGACYLDWGRWALTRPLELYGKLSGASSSYGFFAPAVGGQVRARFEVVDAAGNRQPVDLRPGESHEADIRVEGIYGEFMDTGEDAKKLQRSIAASLAGTVFGRHPEAKEVYVRLEELWPVSMAEYRSGRRNEWKFVYQAKFVPNTPRAAR
jgi:hypothetical protein